jgi:hypothetical protein
MMAACLSPGAISESSSSHLPPSEASKKAKPVTFPPGRSSRGTMPLATGSANREQAAATAQHAGTTIFPRLRRRE